MKSEKVEERENENPNEYLTVNKDKTVNQNCVEIQYEWNKGMKVRIYSHTSYKRYIYYTIKYTRRNGVC